jgi:hypothetical protein
MNIAEQFVFVHMPKTGGSFVSAILRTLHGQGRIHELFLRSERLLTIKNQLTKMLGGKPAHEEFNKHGTCHEIPATAVHLPILSCMRNPYDWYVSNYKYAWWRSHPQDYPGLADDPRWPDLSFADYLALSHTRWLNLLNSGVPVNPSLGRLTVLFVNYYCRHPDQILELTDEADLTAAIKDDMFPVHFLHTETLNRDLFDYLATTKQYEPDSLTFILEKKKISPRNQRQAHESWPLFFDEEMKTEIAWRDRALFALFPHYRS